MNGSEHNLSNADRESGQRGRQYKTTITQKPGVTVISFTAPAGEELIIDMNRLDELQKACIKVAKDPQQLELAFD